MSKMRSACLEERTEEESILTIIDIAVIVRAVPDGKRNMTENENTLENFLQGKPLNESLKRLMESGDEIPEEAEDPSDSGPIDDDDREHLRRMLVDPGWQVLLKLLDIEIGKLEDSAKTASLMDPFNEDNKSLWAQAAYITYARKRVVDLAQGEVGKMKRNG